MSLIELLHSINSEIAILKQARALLAGSGSTGSRRAAQPKKKKKRHMSAEGRARIAAAQRKRWAKQKRAVN